MNLATVCDGGVEFSWQQVQQCHVQDEGGQAPDFPGTPQKHGEPEGHAPGPRVAGTLGTGQVSESQCEGILNLVVRIRTYSEESGRVVWH